MHHIFPLYILSNLVLRQSTFFVLFLLDWLVLWLFQILLFQKEQLLFFRSKLFFCFINVWFALIIKESFLTQSILIFFFTINFSFVSFPIDQHDCNWNCQQRPCFLFTSLCWPSFRKANEKSGFITQFADDYRQTNFKIALFLTKFSNWISYRFIKSNTLTFKRW